MPRSGGTTEQPPFTGVGVEHERDQIRRRTPRRERGRRAEGAPALDRRGPRGIHPSRAVQHRPRGACSSSRRSRPAPRSARHRRPPADVGRRRHHDVRRGPMVDGCHGPVHPVRPVPAGVRRPRVDPPARRRRAADGHLARRSSRSWSRACSASRSARWLQWIGSLAGEWWATGTSADLTLDPLAGIVGALITATAFMGGALAPTHPDRHPRLHPRVRALRRRLLERLPPHRGDRGPVPRRPAHPRPVDPAGASELARRDADPRRGRRRGHGDRADRRARQPHGAHAVQLRLVPVRRRPGRPRHADLAVRGDGERPRARTA